MATTFEYTFIEAAANGELDILEEYFSKKIVNINAGQSSTGHTALMAAVSCNEHPCVAFLIQNDANINQQDFQGHSALHYAVEHQNETLITTLIYAGIDINLKNHNGLNAYQYALHTKNNLNLANYIKATARAEQKRSNQNTNLNIEVSFKSASRHIKNKINPQGLSLKRRRPR